MSRKITLSVPVDIVVRDRDVKLLAIIDRINDASGPRAHVSLSTLSDEMGLSQATLRRSVYACCEDGYLEVRKNYMKNGAQLENSYQVTPDGIAIVKAARQAGLVA